jgi:hypothetical protein
MGTNKSSAAHDSKDTRADTVATAGAPGKLSAERATATEGAAA